MPALRSFFFKPQGRVRGLNIFLAVLQGIALGCVSASILYAVDSLIGASGSPISSTEPGLDQLRIVEMVIVGIFFAPVLETVVFQLLVFELIGVESWTKLRKAIIVSTLFFSSAHYIYGGYGHVGRMIVLGGILALGYAWARGKTVPAAFCLTLSAHTAHNAIIIFSGFLL